MDLKQFQSKLPDFKAIVLIYFRSGVVHYQCVLIAFASDLSNNKPRQGQHKFWRYVSPIRTYFAWLPKQLALTYCRAVATFLLKTTSAMRSDFCRRTWFLLEEECPVECRSPYDFALLVGEMARGLFLVPFVPHSHNRQSQFRLQTTEV